MKIESNVLCACLLAAVLASTGCQALVESSPQPILSVSSQNVDFGNVAVGTTTTLDVTFSNVGTGSLLLRQDSVSGPSFAASGIGAGVTLAPGQHVALTLSFTPFAAGAASGIVSLSSNASNSPVNISLSGVGVIATHSVSLGWTASTSVVVGYNIYRSEDSGATWTKLNSAPTPSTSYTDWDVQGGQSYVFTVTAVDAANNESVFSNLVPALIPNP